MTGAQGASCSVFFTVMRTPCRVSRSISVRNDTCERMSSRREGARRGVVGGVVDIVRLLAGREAETRIYGIFIFKVFF